MTYLLLSIPAFSTATGWSPTDGIIMILCNIIAIAIGKVSFKNMAASPALPMPKYFGGMGLPALLATMSFGHVLGIGAIVSLASF